MPDPTPPAGYNTPNVQKPDGTWEIHGVIDIKTATGGVFKVDGVATTPADAMVGVTASAAEINKLDGLATTQAELALLAGAGTTVASGTQASSITNMTQTSADTSPITAAVTDVTAAKLTDVQALQVDYDKMVIDMAAVTAKLNAVLAALDAFQITA